jgi:hypothetical protein
LDLCILDFILDQMLLRRSSFVLTSLFVFLINSSGIAVAASCSPIFPSTTCSNSEDITITATVPDSTATFTGFAPGSSTVTFKDNTVVTGTVVTLPSGTFTKTVISTPGLHDFAVYFTDTSGRTTPETLFPGINLPYHADTPISNVHLPPTIELTRDSIVTGESTTVLGQAAPGSTIHVFLNGVEVYSALIGAGSDWQHTFSSGYQIGSNTLKAYLTRTGAADSIYSFDKTLTVGSCRRSDLNCDGQVNLTDFSILLYYWDSSWPTADTNHDGIVGLIDFSIMLFDWTE